MECLELSNVSAHYVNAALSKPQLPGGDSQPAPDQQVQQARALVAIASHAPEMRQPVTFADLPPEIREMIWWYALPESRVFNALVYASVGLKMQLLERASLRLPLAHVCFESREAVRRAGYKLAFRDEDESEDPGVWFHPRKDVIERTIWGPGDFWGMR
ncbi:hypothetical protein F4821DRAFT_220712 [Hypoxylon rubiginosum]|uniref:Uncharacterized protein n=1 Tax=Hypoxylon rubiginosum TaxID=110542 RepID=A0ACC0DL07_9PEZI|nr:hypothetical protein F4821DRAFT_220712 [Hypoxylon rubiginosum]